MKRDHEQRAKLIDQVRTSAQSMFIPPSILKETDGVRDIERIWASNLRSMMVGTFTWAPKDQNFRLSHGPSSWAALGSTLKVFDDQIMRPEGVEEGEGYTDGTSLFIPLSTLSQKISEAPHNSALAWLDQGLSTHAAHLLGVNRGGAQHWKMIGSNIDPIASRRMSFALSQYEPSMGPWCELSEAAAKQTTGEFEEGGTENALMNLVSSLKPGLFQDLVSESDAAKWWMDQCNEWEMSLWDVPLALKMARTFFGTETHLAGGKVRLASSPSFPEGIKSHPLATPVINALVQGDMQSDLAVSPMYPGHTDGRMSVMRAQCRLLNKEISARDLAEAVMFIQRSGVRLTPPNGSLGYREIMETLPQLTGGGGMEEEILKVAARYAPCVAIAWGKRNLSKLNKFDEFLDQFVVGLTQNKMGYSDTERSNLVNEFLSLNGGRVYDSMPIATTVLKQAGFCALFDSKDPWAHIALKEVLLRNPKEAGDILAKSLNGKDSKRYTAFEIIFSAGITPDTVVWNALKGKSLPLKTCIGANDINNAFAQYQAHMLNTSTVAVEPNKSRVVRI